MISEPLSSIPEDFEQFWASAAEEVYELPLDYHRSSRNDFDWPGFTVETLSFRSVGGRKLEGWLAFPPGARRLPGFLWLAPYGRESMLPNEYGTREGFTSFSFNFHGHGAFHQEKYVVERGYFSEGAESPESWIFRRMFQDAVMAARVLEAQIEVDEDRIGAMGMSQGGGMAVWLGAWCRTVKAVCADMPFLGRIGQTLQGKVYRYPLKELAEFMAELPIGIERVLYTVSYYDTVAHASRCRKPTHVSLGQLDPAAKPDQVRAIYEALPGVKKLVEYPIGHDWAPEMVPNDRRWLEENLT